ncbi:MAG: glycosyltransferase family 4 protein [Phycisphaerae bacterium]|nr:glycosyltransferase family 4 protein [Phycisphaerae bacterium]
MSTIRKIASYVLLVSAYVFTWLVAVVGHAIPRRRWKPNGRIAVTGTIFNPNWYLSHITPLTRSGVKEVILVIDEPLQPMAGVRFVCPPKWLARLISRAGAKALWLLCVGIRYRPDLFMGYNLVAGGCTALVAGAILGRPACYQMTGGQLVLSTFSYDAFEKAGRFEQRIAGVIERLAVSVIKKFGLVVVRGNKGKAFLTGYGVNTDIAIITGSTKSDLQPPQADRHIDLIFLGRLVPVKQVDQFIEIVHRVSHTVPEIKAAIVGDGPLMPDLKAEVERLKLMKNVEFLGKRADAESLLGQARLFVLTSKSEGLSIAMLEAMRMGTVPVVADIGELGDFVTDSVNGWLITPNCIDEYVVRVTRVLQDKNLWKELSDRAIETSRRRCDVTAVSEAWRQSFQGVIGYVPELRVGRLWNAESASSTARTIALDNGHRGYTPKDSYGAGLLSDRRHGVTSTGEACDRQ